MKILILILFYSLSSIDQSLANTKCLSLAKGMNEKSGLRDRGFINYLQALYKSEMKAKQINYTTNLNGHYDETFLANNKQYRIKEFIGEGSEGWVYVVEDSEEKVLKILKHFKFDPLDIIENYKLFQELAKRQVPISKILAIDINNNIIIFEYTPSIEMMDLFEVLSQSELYQEQYVELVKMSQKIKEKFYVEEFNMGINIETMEIKIFDPI